MSIALSAASVAAGSLALALGIEALSSASSASCLTSTARISGVGHVWSTPREAVERSRGDLPATGWRSVGDGLYRNSSIGATMHVFRLRAGGGYGVDAIYTCQ